MALTVDIEQRPHVLLTQRAAHLTSHPGQIALPGGYQEPSDRSLWQTALRETHEEGGVSASQVKLNQSLGSFYTSKGTGLEAFHATSDASDTLHIRVNPQEVAAYFWFPLAMVIEDQRQETLVFRKEAITLRVPVYQYRTFRIWGVTAQILVALVNQHYHADIKL